MPISKRTLMWWEIVGAVILGCYGFYFLFFVEVGAPGVVWAKIAFGGIPFVGAHVLAVGAAFLRLKGRAAWIGQYLIVTFALMVVLFFLLL